MIAATPELYFYICTPKSKIKSEVGNGKYLLHILCVSERGTFPREPCEYITFPLQGFALAWAWSLAHGYLGKSKYLAYSVFYMSVNKYEDG